MAERLDKEAQATEDRKRRQAFAFGLIMTSRNILNHAEHIVLGDKDIRNAHDVVHKVLEKYERIVLGRWHEEHMKEGGAE